MKTRFFSTLALTAAALTFSPAANAAEVVSTSVQQRRLEVLDTQTKAVDNVQKVRLEHLNNQTKAVDNVQTTRLGFLDN